MKKLTMILAVMLLATALAQDIYVGPNEIAKFDSISDASLAEIKQLRVLFGSRSWGMGMYNDYIRRLGSKYALRWNLFRPMTTTPADSIPHNFFDQPGVLHFREPDGAPHRWRHFADLLRGRNGYPEMGKQVDMAWQFVHIYNGEASHILSVWLPLLDSLRQEYPKVIFGIGTHHVNNATNQYGIDWNVEARAFSDTVRNRYLGKIPIFDIQMIAARCPNGDTTTFSYQGQTYLKMCPVYDSGDRWHFANYDPLDKAFFVFLNEMKKAMGPAFKVTSPNGGETWYKGRGYTVSWVDWTNEPNVTIGIYKSGVQVLTSGLIPNTGSTLWTVPDTLATGSDYKVRVTGTTDTSVWDESDAPFTITDDPTRSDSIAPTILQVPDTKDANTVVIEFSEEMDPVSAEDTANYSINNGITVLTASLSGNIVSLVTTLLSEGVTYTVTVTGVKDNSANHNPIAPGSQGTFAYLAPIALGSVTGYWSMSAVVGGKVYDQAGDNDGTVKGAQWTMDGKYGPGLQFDGNDSLDLGTSVFGLDSTNEFTIALWFNATSLATGDFIKRGMYVNPYRIYLAGSRTGTTVRTDGSKYLTGNIRFQTNTWYHVALTYKSGERVVYVNGQVDTSNAITGTLDLAAGRNTLVGEFFTGTIDEVYILNRAVDQGEINDIMNNVYGGGTTTIPTGQEAVTAAVPFTLYLDNNRLTLGSTVPARALVYDTRGKLSGVLTTQRPVWNTTLVHTGIYLIRVISGNQVYYRRMMICR